MELQAFKSKVLPLKDRLYRIALGMLKSVPEAEDALQDIMLKLWNKRERLSEYKSIEALSVTITKNHCLDKIKAQKHRFDLDVQELQVADKNVSPDRHLELKENMSVMLDAFSRLPEQQRLLIMLRDVEGNSYEEIAEQTGLEINNIRVGLSRARKNAREEYLKVNTYE